MLATPRPGGLWGGVGDGAKEGLKDVRGGKGKGWGGEQRGERRTGRWRDKKRGLGWERSPPLEAFSRCLTPLVLLMCDAQEIDSLCKTQAAGENNNKRRRTREDGSVDSAAQTPGPRSGSGAGPRDSPPVRGRLAELCHPAATQGSFCTDAKGGQIQSHRTPAWSVSTDPAWGSKAPLLFFM